MLPLLNEEIDLDKIAHEYALSAFHKETINRASNELDFAKTPANIRDIVHSTLENLGLPGFYKLKKLDDRQISTFGGELRSSFSRKILEVVRQHEKPHRPYCKNKIIFDDSQNFLYLIDTDTIDEGNAKHLSDLMISFRQKINTCLNNQVMQTNR